MKAFEGLLTIASSRRQCEVFRCRGTKDLVHLILANPKWRKPQDVWVCSRHKEPFTKAAEDAGCIVEVMS